MTQAQNTAPRNALTWFEIPVHDLDRAQSFYETLLGKPLRRESMAGDELAIFQYDEGPTSVGGCLAKGALSPAEQGTLVYLNAEPSLDAVLGRVQQAGGKVALSKVQLPGDMGWYAHITDTEGNRVGLHALA